MVSGWRFAALAAIGGITACLPLATPAPMPRAERPTIRLAGRVADVEIGEVVRYRLADGHDEEISPHTHRPLTEHGWSGELIVIGSDSRGPFVAAFATQEGMPPDCYVENARGVDRGRHVEIGGLLWKKVPRFEGFVPPGSPYPDGSRFCLDEGGRVASVVAP